MLPFDLLLITDPGAPLGLYGSVAAALSPAPPRARVAVQLRAKGWTDAALLEAGHRLRRLTADCGLRLLVNARCDLALAVEADGVHLPEGGLLPQAARDVLGARALIGRSCHASRGPLQAAPAADYVTLSPYFAVPGKGTPLSADEARHLCQHTPLPVLALGGIGPDQVPAALASGAWGVSVIRSVLHAGDPSAALRALLRALDHARQAHAQRHTSPGSETGKR